MEISPAGIDLIKSHEGLRLTAYFCPAGVPTIGYGHTGPDVTEADVVAGKRINQREANRLLSLDLRDAVAAVNASVTVPLAQHHFDALVSFVFNIGANAFRKSTLLRLLNAADYDAVPEQLMRWVYADGLRLKGLVKRRADEAAMFAGRRSENATPDDVDARDAVRRMVG